MEVPQAPCALIHSLEIQSRFGDYDAFRHVNNNAYLQYFDLGKMSFMEAVAGHSFEPKDMSAVIVNINVNFYAPTVLGEAVTVKTGISHVGERAFTVYQQVVSRTTGQVKATAETILAGFDIATQSGAPLQDWLRNALEVAVSRPK